MGEWLKRGVAAALIAVVAIVVLATLVDSRPPAMLKTYPIRMSTAALHSPGTANWIADLCIEPKTGIWSCGWMRLPHPTQFVPKYADPPKCVSGETGATICVNSRVGEVVVKPPDLEAPTKADPAKSETPKKGADESGFWRFGHIAFNNPSPMTVGESAEVEVVLSTALDSEQLQLELKAPGRQQSAYIEVGRRMRASLTGAKDDFDISRIGAEVVAISDNRIARWKWQVTPKRSGQRSLYLVLSAVIKVDGTDTDYAEEKYSHKIDVSVSWTRLAQDLVAKHWQWLWAFILVPLAVWLWGVFKEWRRKKKGWKPPGAA